MISTNNISYAQPQKIIKRDGRVVDFDPNFIDIAIAKCFMSIGRVPNVPVSELVGRVVRIVSAKSFYGNNVTVEDIQDNVEKMLLAQGEYDAAKKYILYRAEHEKMREERPIPEEVRLAFQDAKKYFPTPIQEFMYLDHYSRFDWEKGRRETWPETVDRTVNFLYSLSKDKLSGDEYDKIRRAILEMKVMPSMRLLAMAGPAADRTNITIYNCFGRETRFVTSGGVKSFFDFNDGDSTVVLTHTGEWKRAKVRNYGKQMLQTMTFSRGAAQPVSVRATSNHEWILKNGTRSTNLLIGDHVLSAPNIFDDFNFDTASPFEKLYWCYGMVYGDGTKVKNNGDHKYSMIRLCGSDKNFASRFEEVGFKTSTNLSLNGDVYAYTGSYLKTLPNPEVDSTELIRAFVHGYLSADGAKDSCLTHITKFKSIQTSNVNDFDFIEKCFPIAGVSVMRYDDFTGQVTNYGVRPETRRYIVSTNLNSKTAGMDYIVRKIEVSEDKEDVWCLEVEDNHSFVLDCGISTGNCSYAEANSIDAFCEALLISMCGTGFGYSVESRCVNNLPEVKMQNNFDLYIAPHVVEDTTEGWVNALRFGLEHWFDGWDVEFDFSQLRPAGAILKTKGGRSSGPETFKQSLVFIRNRILSRQGGNLRPLDAHDIMCSIASAAVSGGVRRSAMISLFDFNDYDMLHCKDGDFERENSQRWNANNSAVWPDNISQREYMRTFMSMIESERGEPGIFNRRVAELTSPSRREWFGPAGTNPCFAPGTLVHTDSGDYPIEQLVGKGVDVWDGEKWVYVDNFRVTAENQPILKLTMQDGSEIRATEYHKFILEDGRRLEAKDLRIGNKLMISDAPETHGKTHVDGAYLKGFLVGDGTHTEDRPVLFVYQPKECCEPRLARSAMEIARGKVNTNAVDKIGFDYEIENSRTKMTGLAPIKEELYPWCTEYKKHLPTDIFSWDRDSKIEFIAGVMDADGGASDTRNGFMYQIWSINREWLLDFQALLKTVGVHSKLSLGKSAGKKDFNDGYGEYDCKDQWRLTISQISSVKLSLLTKFERLVSFEGKHITYKISPRFNKIVSIEADGVESKVYCCTVPDTHAFSLTCGITTAQCGEIFLHDQEFCNLSIAVARQDDTFDSLSEKVQIASLIGTIQSMATYFPGLRSQWKVNCESERLLGVDINGQMDCKIIQDSETMQKLRFDAVETNKYYANKLGISQSAAVTCVKPGGNSSQLLNCSSGIHARWAPYYIRNIRVSSHSPLCKVLRDAGVPMDPENGQVSETADTWVIHFPVKAPSGSKTRNDRTAIEQCKYWLLNKQNWTEHNPSVTITYKVDEALDIMKWAWDHKDVIAGMAFLPSFDAQYMQLPYIEITEEEYNTRVSEFPDVDFSKIYRYEVDDNTTAAQEIACSSGMCDLQ